MKPRGSRFIFILLSAAFPLSCGRPHRETDDIAYDRKVETDILWKMKDDHRFDEVRVECTPDAVNLRGRVATPQASTDAAAIARFHAGNRRVQNLLEVKSK